MAQAPIPPQATPPQPTGTKATVQAYATRAVPWRGDVLWWVVLVEGLVAFLVGLYIVLQPEQASGILIRLVGAFVLFDSIMAIVRLLRGQGEAAGPGRWIRVGIGLVVGLVAFGYPWMAAMTVGAAATVLAIGILVIGVLGIYAIFATRAVAGWRWGQMIIYGLYILLAGLIFYRNISATELWILPALGWITLIGGVALLGYGVWLYQKYASAKAASDAAAVLATSPATMGVPGDPATAATPAASVTPADAAPTSPALSTASASTSSVKPPKATASGQNTTASSDGNGTNKPTS